jgi:hypothetical protein
MVPNLYIEKEKVMVKTEILETQVLIKGEYVTMKIPVVLITKGVYLALIRPSETYNKLIKKYERAVIRALKKTDIQDLIEELKNWFQFELAIGPAWYAPLSIHEDNKERIIAFLHYPGKNKMKKP